MIAGLDALAVADRGRRSLPWVGVIICQSVGLYRYRFALLEYFNPSLNPLIFDVADLFGCELAHCGVQAEGRASGGKRSFRTSSFAALDHQESGAGPRAGCTVGARSGGLNGTVLRMMLPFLHPACGFHLLLRSVDDVAHL